MEFNDLSGIMLDPSPPYETGVRDESLIRDLTSIYGPEKGMEVYRKLVIERAKLQNIRQKGFSNGS